MVPSLAAPYPIDMAMMVRNASIRTGPFGTRGAGRGAGFGATAGATPAGMAAATPVSPGSIPWVTPCDWKPRACCWACCWACCCARACCCAWACCCGEQTDEEGGIDCDVHRWAVGMPPWAGTVGRG